MLKITWLGQGGYMLCDGTTALCIDPYLSDSVFKNSGKARLVAPPIKPEELECDVMICTHNHLDHVDPDTISVMRSYAFLGTLRLRGEDALARCGEL